MLESNLESKNMARLKANSTLGSNSIFTTASSTDYRGNSFGYSLQTETVTSGFSIFKHANGIIQYGYITDFVGPQQGDQYGYIAGGITPQPFPNAPVATNFISRFPFSAETVIATDPSGTQSTARYSGANFSSSTHGYTVSGSITASTPPAPPKTVYQSVVSNIDKTPIASGGPATALSPGLSRVNSASGNVGDGSSKGYIIGGTATTYPHPYAVYNDIYSYNIVSDLVGSDIGDTSPSTLRLQSIGSTTSATDGYILGGFTYNTPGPNGATPPPTGSFNSTYQNTIKKFPFSSNSPATTAGTLTRPITGAVGISSAFFGYSVGGTTTPTPSVPYASNADNFYKFPFASVVPVAQVGSLLGVRGGNRFHQSTTRGYIGGESFPFSSDTPSVSTITTFSPPTSPTTGNSFSG